VEDGIRDGHVTGVQTCALPIFNAVAGVRLFGGLAATGGVRAVRTKIDATLTLPSLGRTVEGATKPTLWDPLIGVDWRAGGERLKIGRASCRERVAIRVGDECVT